MILCGRIKNDYKKGKLEMWVYLNNFPDYNNNYYHSKWPF